MTHAAVIVLLARSAPVIALGLVIAIRWALAERGRRKSAVAANVGLVHANEALREERDELLAHIARILGTRVAGTPLGRLVGELPTNVVPIRRRK